MTRRRRGPPYFFCDSAMKRRTKIIVILIAATPVAAGASAAWAGDPAAGKTVFEAHCRTCHAALPYPGRVANLAAFLAKPRGYNPKTAMRFRGLKTRKDIDDVIAYVKDRRQVDLTECAC